MTPLQEAVVYEAMLWVGTPFRANAKLRGVGADCIGVVAGAFEGMGIDVSYRNDYSQKPDGTLRSELLRRGFAQVRGGSREPADVILMAFRDSEPHHIALMAFDGKIIHAYAQARKCVLTVYEPYWSSITRGVFRHPGLAA